MPVEVAGKMEDAKGSTDDGRVRAGSCDFPSGAGETEQAEKTYTFDEGMDAIGWGAFHRRLLMVCGVGYMAEVIELVMTSFLIPVFEREDFEWRGSVNITLLGSCSYVGMFFGALFWSALSDSRGRRLAFVVTVAMTFVVGLGSAFAPTFGTFVFLRALVGFAVGGQLPIDFAVYTEYLPSHGRGKHIVYLATFASGALMITTGTAYVILEILQASWRWVPALLALPSLLTLFLRSRIPESPRFLLVQDQLLEAEQVLASVARFNGVPPPSGRLVHSTISASHDVEPGMERRVHTSMARGSAGDEDDLPDDGVGLISLRDEHSRFRRPRHPLLAPLQQIQDPRVRRVVAVLAFCWFMIQFGQVGVYVWAPSYFKSRGIAEDGDGHLYRDLLLMVSGQLPGLLLVSALVERPSFGRVRTVRFFLFASGVCTMILAAVSSEAFLVASSASTQFFLQSAYALMYVLSLELVPTQVRCSALGVGHACARFSAAVAPSVGAALLSVAPSLAIATFALSFMLASGGAMMLRETRGAKLQDTLA